MGMRVACSMRCSTAWPVVPSPVVAQRMPPGMPRASASMPSKSAAFSAGVPTSSMGVRITPATGVTEAAARPTAVAAAKTRVRPSGALRASSSSATVPLAPGRLSTITAVPHCCASCSARARATMSLTPPAG